jgi:AcrR family transcriptional regulator
MRATKESGNQSYESVLKRALVMVVENPRWDFSISDLKKTTGLSTGTLYHHFPEGAQSVAEALYARVVAKSKAAILARAEKARNLDDLVKILVNNYLQWHELNEAESMFITRSADYSGFSKQSPELQRVQEEFGQRVGTLLSGFFHNESIETKVSLSIVMSMIFGAAQETVRAWNRNGRQKQEMISVRKTLPLFIISGLRAAL